MSIEQQLERIADALEVIIERASQDVVTETDPDPKPVKEEKAKKKTATKKAAKKQADDLIDEEEVEADAYSEDDLRSCFQEFVGRKGNEEGTSMLKQLISKYGATKIGEIKSKDYAAIIKEVQSWK